MNYEIPRPRVNASMLPSLQGRYVTLLGIGGAVDNSGMAFQLKTCDSQMVTIKLREPVQDYIDGLVEVHGVVNADNTIGSDHYILLGDQQAAQTFDMTLYNKAVQYMHQAPEHYIVGTSEQ